MCGSSGTTNQGLCNLTINDNNLIPGNVYTITINGPGQFLQQLNPAIPFATTSDADCTATVTSFSATTLVVTITGSAACGPGAGTVTVQELVAVTGPGTVSQTVVGSGGTSGAVTVNAIGLPAFSQNVPATITKACTAPGLAGQPAGTVVVGQTITCTVTVAYTVAPTTPQALTIAVTNGTLTSAATVTCAAGSTVCTFTETITATTVGVIPTQTITTNGVTFTPALTGIVAVIAANAGFINGDRFIIRCPAAFNAAVTTSGLAGVIPGPIGGQAAPVAIGILPSALICEALFVTTNAAGVVVDQNVAPGSITVSALAGTLVDLSGGLSTTLVIACNQLLTSVADDLVATLLNSCAGVRFGLLGLGVGFVELRARYEPSSLAAQAGIRERETSATVAFVAPLANLNLLLNPNPVAVGATGTATARFNRLTIFAGDLLINPQTGIPLTVSFGTALNGTVFFTSSDPAIASFVGGLATGADLTTGIIPGAPATGFGVTTGALASIRCGSAVPAIAQSAFLGAQSLPTFFGGCTEASVQYRGNLQGFSTITATFVADLPGAFGGALGLPQAVNNLVLQPSIPGNVQALVNSLGINAVNNRQAVLEVVGIAVTTQRLVPGCNNVVAPASETVAQVIARVDPSSAVVSVFKQVPGTTQFQGAPGPASGAVPAGVANLTNVNALDAIFICVNAAATYRLT
jgi:hypothetical protein